MVTTRTGQADEFTSSSESQLSQYTQDTLVIREDQPGVSPPSLQGGQSLTHAPALRLPLWAA